ncbi:hypothetical protein XA68_17531 [Ophiocordyceps unilateralis]|uniref:Peptidase M43 pregnancy-associated plasma-A domain-containing protein n=1 Tax=Ophiocordyceps unilateralis TaxID=268505 RepID=A0A2A9P3T4_OPHUN|nr:hypothetical protein XA68_17531 [Ophiocordyceps unilateralis]
MVVFFVAWLIGLMVTAVSVVSSDTSGLNNGHYLVNSFSAGKLRQRRGAITLADFRPLQIDVYANVYVRTDGEERLTRYALDKQMLILNEAYEKAKIQFTLKEVEWVVENTWALGNDTRNMVYQNYQGDYSKLNLHIVEYLGTPFSDHHGRCSFPVDGDYIYDGCVFSAHNIPNGPGYDSPRIKYKALGKIMIHGIGHWLGLYDEPLKLCHDSPDMSTMPLRLDSLGCPIRTGMCARGPDPDMVHNYMVSATNEYGDRPFSCLFFFF